ncbi:MAG: CBS domain-containing protein [Chloroflexi bacterium]|nr:CBS domain-containing protein [Chloroflexota bacterium]
MLLASIMTRQVVTVAPEEPVRTVVRRMDEGGFRHIPVVRDGRLAGIVSDRDLLGAAAGTVGQVMRFDVVTAAEDTPLEVAASLMAERKIGCLPVVDPARAVIGIVSQTDLFLALARILGGGTPSTRLQLTLREPASDLATVTALARDRDVRIVTLVTDAADPHALDRQLVVLRVATIHPGPFVTALQAAGILVDLPTPGGPHGA